MAGAAFSPISGKPHAGPTLLHHCEPSSGGGIGQFMQSRSSASASSGAVFDHGEYRCRAVSVCAHFRHRTGVRGRRFPSTEPSALESKSKRLPPARPSAELSCLWQSSVRCIGRLDYTLGNSERMGVIGTENKNVAPGPSFGSVHRRPLCRSMIERLTERPTPIPALLVV